MPRPAKERTRCQQCGGHGLPSEYHPYAYCILHEALGEDSARANLNAVLDHGRKLERLGLPNDAPIGAVREQDADAPASPKGRRPGAPQINPRRRN